MDGMKMLTATRVLAARRAGSSRPILVDTPASRRLVKLRGAGQGTGALVAEVIVAALAEALGLRVPARSLVVLEKDTPSDERDAEVVDLLAASVGLNLGFAPLDDAREIGPSDLPRLDPAETAAVLWLDRLVLNPDRTRRNPNLLWCDERLWLIDHGAALRFQYDWSAVTEATPRELGLRPEPHIFEAAAGADEWATWDSILAGLLTRTVLESAVAAVPASFLVPLLPDAAPQADALRRRRAAYTAFLWKRLQPPRAFARPQDQRHASYGSTCRNGFTSTRLKTPSVT
jgi:hypothetical protein